jgi:iron uptake system EfeUOB component EfeO/EfeM
VTATDAFRAEVGAASSSLVADVGRLQVDLGNRDTSSARRDELAAQGHYDRIRTLVAGNAANASALDQRVVDVPVGQMPGGLHAVERDLWTADGATDQTRSQALSQALADVGGLAAQAPVAEFLLSRDSLDPQAIGTVGVDELGWVNDSALPGREELYSHLDAVDVVATVDAARHAFADIQPLGTLVNPALTDLVAERFATLATEVSALGPPEQLTDAAISSAARLTLSRQVDATATGLSWLAADLVPFGTSGGPS